ncbi:MAG: MFS transporter, partial [Patescibacteria group bacterium]
MKKSSRLVLIVSILAAFVAFLDSSVVNVALPAIVRDLGGGLAAQQWVVDAYLLSLGSFILVAGSFSDLFGRKKILSAGLLGFLATSILCALAPNVTFLIVARALQGVAGALLVPSSLALIIATFKGKEQATAIGIWTAWTGMAFIVGPLLGGFLVDALSWRWAFWMNVIPIAVTLFLLRIMALSEKLPKKANVDIIGALLCVVALGGPVYAFIEQPHYGWSSAMVYAPLLIGLVTGVVFLLYEKRIKHPMLPLKLFGVRNFSVGNVATTFIYAGLSVALFLIVIFVQQIGGYSAFKSGLTLLPVTLVLFVLSPKFGALAGKHGPRLFMAAGPIIGGLGLLSLLRVDAPINYWTQMFPGILVFSLGLSMTVAPLTAAILGDIDSRNAGVGSAINNAVARIAGLIAIALLGLVIGANPFAPVCGQDFAINAFHKGVIAMSVLLLIGGIISA